MNKNIDLMFEVADGKFNDHTKKWLKDGFALYLNESGQMPITQCLKIPNKVKRSQIAIRDVYLRQAGMLIQSNGGSFIVAKNLRFHATKFRDQKWRQWKNFNRLPDGVSDFDKLLYLALKSGADLPTSDKQFHRIIKT